MAGASSQSVVRQSQKGNALAMKDVSPFCIPVSRSVYQRISPPPV
jgi:hypothetical protein